jgi:hypothetical protein
VATQKEYLRCALTRGWTLAAVVFAVAGQSLAVEQARLDSLTIDGNTYSNITVVGKTASHIEFKHAHGFASVKAKMLPEDVQIKLGYTPPPPPKKPLEDLTKDVKSAKENFLADPRVKELVAFVQSETERLVAGSDPRTVQAILGGVICIYILFCSAVYLICRKTTTRAGIWAWVPGFQFVSLFKAAGMSPGNILLLLVPVVNIVITIIWCFRIARTRQKSSVVGFLLLIPIVNIFAFFYLAFSSAPRAEPVQSQKVRLSFQPAPQRS